MPEVSPGGGYDASDSASQLQQLHEDIRRILHQDDAVGMDKRFAAGAFAAHALIFAGLFGKIGEIRRTLD